MHHLIIRLQLLMAFTLFLVVGAGAQTATVKRPPHVILILTDDMGYGDISSFFNRSLIATPNIDRLAQSGLKLTQYYMRSAYLLSIQGRHPYRKLSRPLELLYFPGYKKT